MSAPNSLRSAALSFSNTIDPYIERLMQKNKIWKEIEEIFKGAEFDIAMLQEELGKSNQSLSEREVQWLHTWKKERRIRELPDYARLTREISKLFASKLALLDRSLLLKISNAKKAFGKEVTRELQRKSFEEIVAELQSWEELKHKTETASAATVAAFPEVVNFINLLDNAYSKYEKSDLRKEEITLFSHFKKKLLEADFSPENVKNYIENISASDSAKKYICALVDDWNLEKKDNLPAPSASQLDQIIGVVEELDLKKVETLTDRVEANGLFHRIVVYKNRLLVCLTQLNAKQKELVIKYLKESHSWLHRHKIAKLIATMREPSLILQEAFAFIDPFIDSLDLALSEYEESDFAKEESTFFSSARTIFLEADFDHKEVKEWIQTSQSSTAATAYLGEQIELWTLEKEENLPKPSEGKSNALRKALQTFKPAQLERLATRRENNPAFRKLLSPRNQFFHKICPYTLPEKKALRSSLEALYSYFDHEESTLLSYLKGLFLSADFDTEETKKIIQTLEISDDEKFYLEEQVDSWAVKRKEDLPLPTLQESHDYNEKWKSLDGEVLKELSDGFTSYGKKKLKISIAYIRATEDPSSFPLLFDEILQESELVVLTTLFPEEAPYIHSLAKAYSHYQKSDLGKEENALFSHSRTIFLAADFDLKEIKGWIQALNISADAKSYVEMQFELWTLEREENLTKPSKESVNTLQKALQGIDKNRLQQLLPQRSNHFALDKLVQERNRFFRRFASYDSSEKRKLISSLKETSSKLSARGKTIVERAIVHIRATEKLSCLFLLYDRDLQSYESLENQLFLSVKKIFLHYSFDLSQIEKKFREKGVDGSLSKNLMSLFRKWQFHTQERAPTSREYQNLFSQISKLSKEKVEGFFNYQHTYFVFQRMEETEGWLQKKVESRLKKEKMEILQQELQSFSFRYQKYMETLLIAIGKDNGHVTTAD